MSTEAEIEEKQKILRTSIPEDKYEEFGEFCQAYAGNINIDSWSF